MKSTIIMSVRHPSEHPERTKVSCAKHQYSHRVAWLEGDDLVIPAGNLPVPGNDDHDWREVRGKTYTVALEDLPETVHLFCRIKGWQHPMAIPRTEIERLASYR